MTQPMAELFQSYPEVPVFLALAMGYLVGRIKIKGFGLGTTASVLLAAMLLGQISIEVPALLKNISFALFAFCIGYQVGPQFFGSLRKEGLNYLWISLAVALAGLGTAILLGKVLHFDQGTTAGLFAGAMTQSAVIGTAQGAVAQLSIPGGDKAVLNTNIAVAYAITYIFGTVGVILLFKILPAILKLDLKEEARKLEEKMGGMPDSSKMPGLFSWSRAVGLRAYRVTDSQAVGKTVRQVERLFPERITIEKVERDGSVFDTGPETVLRAQDVLVMTGNYRGLLAAVDIVGDEVDASTVTELVGESLDICVLDHTVVGKRLAELGERPEARGLFLRRIIRQGRELPLTMETVVNKCDIMQLVGAKSVVERAAQSLGYAERPTAATDLVMLGAGCALGTLLGMIVLPIAGVPVTLGVGGGVLISGLIFGWLRSIHPTFGQISEGGQWLLNDLGLNLFIACIGLVSGKQAVQAMQSNGMTIFLAGIVLAIVPILVGVFFGRHVLKMHPALLLGALTGARVIPPALTALEEDAESSMLTLGFAAPFAFANVFLTILGSVIVNIM